MSGRLYRQSMVRLRPRVRLRLRVLVLVSSTLAALGGCGHKAKTPAEAFKRFSEAVKAGDGGALFDSLDQETRWNWMSIQKFHREAYDIVLSNFPDGPERERATKRFEKAATSPSARELFKNDAAPTLLPMLLPLTLAEGGIVSGPGDDQAAATFPTGGRVELKRGKNGGWGFAGLAKQAEEGKNRAYHDLEVVRASAADYERAAARAGK